MTTKEIQAVLRKHFPSRLPAEKFAAAAKDFAELNNDEWPEVEHVEKVIGANHAVQCEDICTLRELHKKGTELRVFKKKA